jgi:hypothetical protein
VERRTIDIYYDVTGKCLLSSTGEIARESDYPYVYFTEEPLVRLRLVSGSIDDSYTGLSSDLSFVASVANDYTHSSAPIARSVGATDINQTGDWDEIEDSNYVYDKFAIRLNLNTETAETAVGATSEAKNAKMEFKAYSEGKLVFAISFPMRVFNLMDPSIVSLATLDDMVIPLDDRYVKKNNEGANWRIAADGSAIELFDDVDGLFHPLILSGGVLGQGEGRE